MFLRKTKVKGNIYWQIVEVVEGKQKLLLHLGTVEKIYKKLVTKTQNGVGDKAQQQKEPVVYKEGENFDTPSKVTNQEDSQQQKDL